MREDGLLLLQVFNEGIRGGAGQFFARRRMFERITGRYVGVHSYLIFMAFVQRLAFHIGERDASRLSVAGMDLVFYSARHQIRLLAIWTMGVH